MCVGGGRGGVEPHICTVRTGIANDVDSGSTHCNMLPGTCNKQQTVQFQSRVIPGPYALPIEGKARARARISFGLEPQAE